MSEATFPRFSCLPTELRILIWHAAIPEQDAPALFIYHPDCCIVRREIVHDELPDHILNFDYIYAAHTRVFNFSPLSSACSESRAVVRRWVLEEQSDDKPQYWYEEERKGLIRAFDPKLDALYVPLEFVHGFGCQFTDRLFETENLDQRIGYTRAHIRHLVIPHTAFTDGTFGIIPEVLDFLPDLSVLSVVLDHAHIDEAQDGSQLNYVSARWQIGRALWSNKEMLRRITLAKQLESDIGNLTISNWASDYLQEHGRLPFDFRFVKPVKTNHSTREPT